MTPSVSFYRFPLRTAEITNTRAEDIRYLSQNNGSFIDGWVFTCKSKIMNLQTCLNDSVDNSEYDSVDWFEYHVDSLPC
jgi:hypothetical protein